MKRFIAVLLVMGVIMTAFAETAVVPSSDPGTVAAQTNVVLDLNQNIALSSSIFFIIKLDDVTRMNPITDCNRPAAEDIPMSLFIFNDLYTNVLITFVTGNSAPDSFGTV